MKKVMLVQPWNYHDENIEFHNLSNEWRNGPYNLLCLATQLTVNNIPVKLVDLQPVLVYEKGKVANCLHYFNNALSGFKPDIIGISFFSYQFNEVKVIMEYAKKVCSEIGINPMFLAGGIHASIEPKQTIEQLGFDYVLIGEGELGLLELGTGKSPESIQGISDGKQEILLKGQEIGDLNKLPFADWSLCDYHFYSHPSYAKTHYRASKTLDLMMGRGCVNRCKFCAYSSLCSLRFYSKEYLVKQIKSMKNLYDIDSVYFIDSSVGNNRKLLEGFCELCIKEEINKEIEWYANMRSNQVDEKLLRLMWEAGCRSLFYGFESGSQRVLNLMNKGCTVEQNMNAANLHNKLKFPYHASILLGYPGETEEDILQTHEFMQKVCPPKIGVNWYVPLPGSDDYEMLKSQRRIAVNDPHEWRKIGEVLSIGKVYADVEEKKFREMYVKTQDVAQDIMCSVERYWFGTMVDSRIQENEKGKRVKKVIDEIFFNVIDFDLIYQLIMQDELDVVIFGASETGEIIYRIIKEINKRYSREINILAVVDSDKAKWATVFLDRLVESPEKQNLYKAKKIVIASHAVDAIKAQLKQMGINEDRILIPFNQKTI